MPAASRSIEIDVPPASLMAVIVDFGRYPEFVPDMARSTVLRHDGAVWSVAFTLRLIRNLEYTLLLEQVDPLHLRWSMVEGVFKANNGGWELEPLDEGRRTRATYSIDLDLGMFVPGSVMKTIVEINLPAMLEAFKRRAEGQHSAV